MKYTIISTLANMRQTLHDSGMQGAVIMALVLIIVILLVVRMFK